MASNMAFGCWVVGRYKVPSLSGYSVFIMRKLRLPVWIYAYVFVLETEVHTGGEGALEHLGGVATATALGCAVIGGGMEGALDLLGGAVDAALMRQSLALLTIEHLWVCGCCHCMGWFM